MSPTSQPVSTAAYKAVFFDLDGTLLPMDIEAFLRDYFAALNGFAVRNGLEPKSFADALNRGIHEMTLNDGSCSNAQVFWEAFDRIYGPTDMDPERIVTEFYETDFGAIGDNTVPNPAAAQAVNTLSGKGYRLFLTTMPLFPRAAVEWRLRWAGVDPSSFERLTTYDNSFAAKPSLDYYRQNIEIAQVAAEEVLMVGNNTREDMAALQLGCSGYLVTDYLLDPDGFDLSRVPHGTLADFALFAQEMPLCR